MLILQIGLRVGFWSARFVFGVRMVWGWGIFEWILPAKERALP